MTDLQNAINNVQSALGEAMTIHTPGPWRVDRDSLHVRRADGLGVAQALMGGVYINSLDGGTKWYRPIEEATANAHLIAAAPDLLEALHGALEVLVADAERLGLDPHEHHHVIRDAMEKALPGLAKGTRG